ncbi:hypothetical protein EJ110_NYTH48088, partial [Nymphaea thermarum]
MAEEKRSSRLQTGAYIGDISALCLLHVPSSICSRPFILAENTTSFHPLPVGLPLTQVMMMVSQVDGDGTCNEEGSKLAIGLSDNSIHLWDVCGAKERECLAASGHRLLLVRGFFSLVLRVFPRYIVLFVFLHGIRAVKFRHCSSARSYCSYFRTRHCLSLTAGTVHRPTLLHTRHCSSLTAGTVHRPTFTVHRPTNVPAAIVRRLPDHRLTTVPAARPPFSLVHRRRLHPAPPPDASASASAARRFRRALLFCSGGASASVSVASGFVDWCLSLSPDASISAARRFWLSRPSPYLPLITVFAFFLCRPTVNLRPTG